MRGAATAGAKVLPKAEQAAAGGKVFETNSAASAGYVEGHTNFALSVIRDVARELGVKLPQTAEAAASTAKGIVPKGLAQTEPGVSQLQAVRGVVDGAPKIPGLGARGTTEGVADAGHALEMTPIGEIIKGNLRSPDAIAAAKAATRTEPLVPKAAGALETGEKTPTLVDMVRGIAQGGKVDGAVVSKQNGSTIVNFEEGLFKGSQAIVDDATILIERNGRLTEHTLAPHPGFQKMGNRFVDG